MIRIAIDMRRNEGTLDFVGENGRLFGAEEGARILATRPPRDDLAPHPALPDDTRLWAALQRVGGGTWGGCIYDSEATTRALESGTRQG